MTAPTTDRLARLMRMLEVDPQDAFCLYAVGQEHATRGDHGAAADWFRRAIASDPDHAYARFHLARALVASGDRTGAIDALREGVQAARRTGDAKAGGELAAFLEELGG